MEAADHGSLLRPHYIEKAQQIEDYLQYKLKVRVGVDVRGLIFIRFNRWNMRGGNMHTQTSVGLNARLVMLYIHSSLCSEMSNQGRRPMSN